MAQTPDDFDFEKLVTGPNDQQLKLIATQAGKAVELARQIDGVEEMLKSLKAELHAITNRDLPAAMTEAGLDDFTHSETGAKISIKQVVSGSLPKEQDDRDLAFDWLYEHGAEDLIKEKMEILFDKGQGNLSSEVKMKCEELDIPYQAKKDVHPQTLAAYARERLRNGEEVDANILGLFIGRQAKIEFKKSKSNKGAE